MSKSKFKISLSKYLLKWIAGIFVLGVLISAYTFQSDFIAEQKRYERVRTAFREKGVTVSDKLTEAGISSNELNLLIVTYKEEGILRIYGKRKSESTYSKLTDYSICSKSGQLGPKRKMGDQQVPEGFYHIDRFNPSSSFYLSLGINYPNLADKKKTTASNPGGDIFIHGSCVTIGCLPMTDDKIKEIYLYAIIARATGQIKIPVYIFPFEMTDQNMAHYARKYSNNNTLLEFWKNLKTGYDKFESEKKELKITVNANGDYSF